MQDWLKYFFLSYFSDKRTQEAHKRSFLNGLGCYLLSLILLLFTLFGGYTAAMPSHLNDATEYRNAVYSVLNNNTITIDDNTISVHDQTDNAISINTIKDTQSNDCNIIIDTRDIKSTYTTFDIKYTKDDSAITYDEYLDLSKEDKASFTFTAEYSDTPIHFTDELISSYEEYLNSVDDESIQSSYLDILASKPSMNKDEYSIALYEIYVTAYYPEDVRSLDLYTFAPTLRTYYESLIDQNRSKSFFVIYNDLIYARFYGKNDICYTASASPSQLKDRTIISTDCSDINNLIDGLFKDAFSASSTTIIIEYALNLVRLSALIIIGSLVLALICWLILRSTGNYRYSAYITTFHILLLYTPFSALIGGLVGFISSWFMGRNTAYLVASLVYIVLLCCRMIVYTLCTIIRERKK